VWIGYLCIIVREVSIGKRYLTFKVSITDTCKWPKIFELEYIILILKFYTSLFSEHLEELLQEFASEHILFRLLSSPRMNRYHVVDRKSKQKQSVKECYFHVKKYSFVELINKKFHFKKILRFYLDFQKMGNSSKEAIYHFTSVIITMAVAPQSALEALGFVSGHHRTPGPTYTRFSIVDVWDGARVVPTVMHLPLSTSLITSLLLHCDPDQIIRYHESGNKVGFKLRCFVIMCLGI